MLTDLNTTYTSPQIKINKDKLDMIFNEYIIFIRDSRDRTLIGSLGAGRCQQNPGFGPRVAIWDLSLGSWQWDRIRSEFLFSPVSIIAPIPTH